MKDSSRTHSTMNNIIKTTYM